MDTIKNDTIKNDTIKNDTIKNDTIKNAIIQSAEREINNIMDEWCKSYSNSCSGGEMRENRGSDIESFVRNTINKIGELLHIHLIAKRGNDDKKTLTIPDTKINKKHQVDVHIYLNGEFIAVIECKSYLDSCYYVRACDDFKLFRKFDYKVKNYIFTLENSISKETKIFTDFITENICDDVFYLLEGKRSSTKPIYDIKYKKCINKKSLIRFIDFIYMLGNIDN